LYKQGDLPLPDSHTYLYCPKVWLNKTCVKVVLLPTCLTEGVAFICH